MQHLNSQEVGLLRDVIPKYGIGKLHFIDLKMQGLTLEQITAILLQCTLHLTTWLPIITIYLELVATVPTNLNSMVQLSTALEAQVVHSKFLAFQALEVNFRSCSQLGLKMSIISDIQKFYTVITARV